MRKPALLISVSLTAIFFFIFLYYSRILFTSGPTDQAPLSKQDRIDLAIQQEFERTKDPASGTVPREKLLQAVQLRDGMIRSNTFRANASVPGITWEERGPSNVGGRTRALIFDLNDVANGYKKVWAGSVGGGLWYTNDITVVSPVWNKVNDLMENLAISCIVQNPLNPQEMYVGTGEGWFNLDAIKGLGIWKTTDGGATWTRLLSTSRFAFINDLLIDKNGHLYASLRQNSGSDSLGVQKSTNGGTSWSRVLGTPGSESSPRGADLELAANGDIYASLGISGSNGGIYTSDFTVHAANTGNVGTWVNITPNTSGTIATPANFWQRIELATAPSDANIVYALFQGNGSNNCTSIQQYNKSSNSWSVKTVPTIIDQGDNTNFTRGQAWYDLVAAVDPNNANSIYIGGVDALRSSNGGSTWTQMTTWSLFAAPGFTSAQNVHADHHAIAFAPGSSGRAIWGTDGGVDYTANADVVAGKPTFNRKNTGYNVTQYYGCALHPTLPNYFLAGAQDNGTQKFTASGINATTNATGGDGGFCHIDQDNPNIQITSYVYNNYFISTNGGASFNTRYFNNNGGFINATDYDDAGNILYGGNTGGSYFRWNDPATAGTSTFIVSCAAFAGASVTHVAVSPTVANRVFFGLSNGSIIRVDNANTGTSVAGTVLKGSGGGSVSGIAIDAANADHMLVTYSNYGVVSVFESINATSGSPTWTAVEGTLPDMPVRWVLFDPRNSDWALIATELGVWSTDNLNGAATDWQPTNGGLANVRVDMLQYRASDNIIAAATHGRGLFTTIVPSAFSTITYLDFASATTSISEQTNTTNGCRRYQDYIVNITPSAATDGAATATYAIQAGNTAVQGIDFDVAANGAFGSPLAHSFASGATAAQTITIRIFDDAQIEAPETFTIRFTVSGFTDLQARNNTYTVTINDNDAAPVALVASALNSTGTEYLVGNSDLYYYNASGEIMARITNQSAHNYGCTEVVIDRAGTDTTRFWNYNPANTLMDKTFTIIPAINNPTGSYQVTLYFTTAEKLGWEAATGQSWDSIKLIKLPGTISTVTPLTPQPDGPQTVQVVTPTIGIYANGHTLTYSFSNGFSGFGAGIPGRMHTILTLTGQQLGSDIKLDWTTSTETGSTVFEVEKSYDGLSFTKIATVNASGNKFIPSAYSSVDQENVELNYYRIRMLHSDGYVAVSNTIFINNNNAPDRPFVLTNPFENQIRVRFARVIQGTALASLYDISGKLIHQSTHPGTNSLLVINVSALNLLSRATYILKIDAEGQRHIFKLKKS